MIEFTLAIPELDGLIRWADTYPERVERALRGAMEKACLDGEDEITRRTPVDKGRLRQGITSRVEGSGYHIRGIVGVSNVRYALWVELGTRPHIIEPRFARALAWQPGAVAQRIGSRRPQYLARRGRQAGGLVARRSGATMVFARRVRHPGTRGAHMFRDGAQAALPRIRGRFRAALEQVAR